jgi:hypothetical protein
MDNTTDNAAQVTTNMPSGVFIACCDGTGAGTSLPVYYSRDPDGDMPLRAQQKVDTKRSPSDLLPGRWGERSRHRIQPDPPHQRLPPRTAPNRIEPHRTGA